MATTKKTTTPEKGAKTNKKPVEKKAPVKKPATKKTTTKKKVKEIPVYTVPVEVKELGASFRALRLEKGITIVKLAEMSGVGKTTIGDFEKGVACPKLDSVIKIAAALGYKFVPVLK